MASGLYWLLSNARKRQIVGHNSAFLSSVETFRDQNSLDLIGRSVSPSSQAPSGVHIVGVSGASPRYHLGCLPNDSSAATDWPAQDGIIEYSVDRFDDTSTEYLTLNFVRGNDFPPRAPSALLLYLNDEPIGEFTPEFTGSWDDPNPDSVSFALPPKNVDSGTLTFSSKNGHRFGHLMWSRLDLLDRRGNVVQTIFADSISSFVTNPATSVDIPGSAAAHIAFSDLSSSPDDSLVSLGSNSKMPWEAMPTQLNVHAFVSINRSACGLKATFTKGSSPSTIDIKVNNNNFEGVFLPPTGSWDTENTFKLKC